MRPSEQEYLESINTSQATECLITIIKISHCQKTVIFYMFGDSNDTKFAKNSLELIKVELEAISAFFRPFQR